MATTPTPGLQPIIPVLPEPTPAQLEELEDESLTEIEAVGEQLALHSIESEARHEQILESIEVNHQCLLRLEQSSNQPENPVNQAMVAEIATLKSELSEVKGMLTAIMASLAALNHLATPQTTPNPSPETTPEPNPEIQAENPEEQRREELTEEQRPVETRRKHRVL